MTSNQINHIGFEFVEIFARSNGPQCFRRLGFQPIIVVQVTINHLARLVPNVTVSFLHYPDELILITCDSLEIIVGKLAL